MSVHLERNKYPRLQMTDWSVGWLHDCTVCCGLSSHRQCDVWCGGVTPAPTAAVPSSASKSSIRRFVITEKDPTRAFSCLKAPTSAFTFKTLLRHYAKQTLTPRSLNVKLGPRHNYHKGRAAIRHYANQTARPL